MNDSITLLRVKEAVAMCGLNSIFNPKAKSELYTKLRRMFKDE